MQSSKLFFTSFTHHLMLQNIVYITTTQSNNIILVFNVTDGTIKSASPCSASLYLFSCPLQIFLCSGQWAFWHPALQ